MGFNSGFKGLTARFY